MKSFHSIHFAHPQIKDRKQCNIIMISTLIVSTLLVKVIHLGILSTCKGHIKLQKAVIIIKYELQECTGIDIFI